MTNKQMDEKIRQAFESITPNVLGAIVSRCTKRAGNVKFMKSRRSTGWTARFITVAAASILILVLTTGLIDRLAPLFPTGPLFTGTDPSSVPTQPDALTWVDWGMNATWVTKNGTTQGQYPMQIKGLIQNKKEIRLNLEIYTPDSLGYQFTAPDGGYSPNQYAGLVDQPGDYYVFFSAYSILANKFKDIHWAISTTKEYFIAYWPEKPDLFLVGASDPNVSAAEVMAYFDKFVEKFRPVEPEPTDPEPTVPDEPIRLDWSMNATWVIAIENQKLDYDMTIKGTIEEMSGSTYLNLGIDVGQNFPYQFTLMGPNGYVAGTGLVDQDGDYNFAAYVADAATKGKVLAAWAISTENEYFIFVIPDDPSMYLVGATDPNVTVEQILAYFDSFADHYQLEQPRRTDPWPADPDDKASLEWSMNATWVTANGFGKSDHSLTVKGTIREKYGITHLNLGVDVGQNFPYQFIVPSPNGYVTGTGLVDQDGDYNVAGYVEDAATKEKVLAAWAISTEKEYFIFVIPDDPSMYLVGATDPNVTVEQILAYFDRFVERYQVNSTPPSVPLWIFPDEFPADLLTDAVTLSVFQEFFDENNYARQASGKYFEDPTKINLQGFFYAIGTVDDIPVTEEDRKAIVDKSGVESFYYRTAYCLSADRMNRVLLQTFGVPLSEMTGFSNLYYLESSGNYCYFHDSSPAVAKTSVMGVRFTDDGNVEVYYVAIRDKDNYPQYYGVITLKPNGNSYYILSNVHIDVWPEPGHVPAIPQGAPDDLNTDPDMVRRYQKVLDNDSWYTQALLTEFDDPTGISRLEDFLFCSGKPWPYNSVTKEEREAVMQKHSITEVPDWWSDWYSMDTATIDEVLQTVFGLTLADFPEYALQGATYLESTGRYYLARSDSSLVWNVSVAGIRELENGNIEVYYTENNTSECGGYVTLQILEDGGYRVISNTRLGQW